MEVIEGYSVLITDNEQSTRGTGTLFYSLEDPKHFYIFTCAHVIDNAEKVIIRMLLPTNGDPEEKIVEANKSQFIFSPIDDVHEIGGQKIHTLDIGVIQCAIGNLILQPTNFFFFPMSAGEKVVSKGYPGYPTEDTFLYYQQDSLEAIVDKVLNKEKYFLIRVNDTFLNHADREVELKGFSGSSIWDEANLRGKSFLCGGVISSAVDYNVSRGRIKVIHANYLRELMLQKFGIAIEMRIPTVPDSDIAPGTIIEKDRIDWTDVRDSWIENERRKAKTHVNTLQLKKAISTIDKVIHNTEFNNCSNEQKQPGPAVRTRADRK